MYICIFLVLSGCMYWIELLVCVNVNLITICFLFMNIIVKEGGGNIFRVFL